MKKRSADKPERSGMPHQRNRVARRAAWTLVAGAAIAWGGVSWAQEQEQEPSGGFITALPAMTVYGDQHGLTMQEAVQRAIAWYPSITETLGRLYQQSEQVAVARSGYFPQVNAGLSSDYRTSSNRTEDTFTVSASQMLYDFGKVSGDVRIERFGMARDQAGVLQAVDLLASETAQAVIEVLRFEALVELADQQVEGVDNIRDLATRRLALGASTESDEIQARSRVDAARAVRESFHAQLTVWRNTLRSLVGLEGAINIVDSFPAGFMQACTVAPEQFANVPEVMIAEAQREIARAQIERRQSDFYPTLSAEASYNRFINQVGNEDDDDVTVGVNLSSSLYRGGATRAQRRSADYALQAVDAARSNTLIELRRSLQAAQDQTLSAQHRLAILEARASSIARTQELYRQQYLSLGTRSLLDLLNAEEEIYQSRFEQVNTRHDMYGLQLECLYAASGFRTMFAISDETVQGISLSP